MNNDNLTFTDGFKINNSELYTTQNGMHMAIYRMITGK